MLKSCSIRKVENQRLSSEENQQKAGADVIERGKFQPQQAAGLAAWHQGALVKKLQREHALKNLPTSGGPRLSASMRSAVMWTTQDSSEVRDSVVLV